MSKTLIGTYASPEDALRARRALEAAGVPPGSIQIHDGAHRASTEPLPEDRGIAGFIRRMFSGATGDAAEIRKYETHARGGGSIIAVENVADQLVDTAAAAMRVGGTVDVHDVASPAPATTGTGDSAVDANEVIATASGPERSALPNAATGWNTSRGGSPSTTGTIGHDPARPQGLTSDAQGLGSGDVSATPDQRTSAAAADAAPDAGSPDALGHRTAGTSGAEGTAPRKP